MLAEEICLLLQNGLVGIESRQIARGSSSWDATRGETVYDSSNYPMTKSYVFGINVTF